MDAETRMSISPRDYLHVVFKRKTLITLFLTVSVATVGVASFRQKRTYEATSQILVKIGRENLYDPSLAGEAGRPLITFDLNAEVGILLSRVLAEKVVETLGPAVIYPDPLSAPSRDEAAEWLQQELVIEAVPDSNIINVSFGHEDPQMAARVVNTVVDLYLERHLEIHKSPQTHEFLGEQSQILDKRLKEAEEKLESFKNEHDLTALAEEQSLLLGQEGRLHAELNRTLSQQAEIEERFQQLRNQLATKPETIPLDLNDDTMEDLRAKLVDLEIKEHELLTKYSDESRLVQSFRNEIKMVRRKLVEHRSQIIQEELLRYQTELLALRAKEESQRSHLADYRIKHEKLNRVEMELGRLEEEIAVHRQNHRLYLTKFEEARISDAMDRKKIANVSVIEPAKPPRKPESRNISRNLVLATMLGGVGGLGMALFSEYLEDKLDTDEDVEYHLNLPVLASIPQLES
jgi:uncharacterized protein involved in exopolysaccharide biosynthesis